MSFFGLFMRVFPNEVYTLTHSNRSLKAGYSVSMMGPLKEEKHR